MLRIGICDDQVDARDALRCQLDKILNENEEQIVYEFTSGRSAVRWLESHPGEIDLLFLDVEMDGLDGLQTAAEIRRFNQEMLLVFVTGYTDYVFDGYQVNALDYIIKPVSSSRLLTLLERIRPLMQHQEETVFVFKNTDGAYRMPYAKICYFYSDKRLVYLVTANAEYPFYAKLNDIDELLNGTFVRIHQRYLVNPQFVDHIGSAAVTIGSTSLPFSRSLKEEATRKLALALFGGSI